MEYMPETLYAFIQRAAKAHVDIPETSIRVSSIISYDFSPLVYVLLCR